MEDEARGMLGNSEAGALSQCVNMDRLQGRTEGKKEEGGRNDSGKRSLLMS